MEELDRTESEAELHSPDEVVEDLEPSDQESKDVEGGKYANVVLKRGADTSSP